MIRTMTPSRAALLTVLLALATPPTPAQAGGRKVAAGNNNQAAMHQQAAMIRQQQATVMHQQQMATRQQQQQQQQARMIQQQQAAARQRQATASSTTAVTPTSTVAGAPPVAGSRSLGVTTGAGIGGTAAHAAGAGARGVGGVGGIGRSAAYRGTNGNQNANHGPLVQALHSTLTRLNQADHDYQGHRARAAHELGQAIQTLQPRSNAAGLNNSAAGRLAGTNGNINGTGKANGNGNGNGQGQKMPQAQSDQHLQAALQNLSTIQTRMAGANTGGTNASHMQRVNGHVGRAIQELNTALALK